MSNIRKIVLMWQILFVALDIHSQTTIKGRVFEGKEPAFAASVFLTPHRGVNTITDDKGDFILEVPDSLYTDTLVVSYLGCKDYNVLLSNWKDSCVIYLVPNQSATTLSEVVVQADPIASKEFAVSQLSKSSIYMTPSASADPLRAVALQPYSTSTEESANPQLRGSTSDYNRVFVNGVPIKNPVRNQQLNGIGNFSLFSADIIGKQFIYPSNPPLEYGNSIGGIVSLNTTDNLTEKHETNLSLSLANVGALHSTQLNDKTFFQIFGNLQKSRLYKLLNSSSLDYLENFSSTDAGVNFRTTVSSKSYINGYAYIVKESYLAERGMYNYLGMQDARNLRNFNILNYRLHTKAGVLGVNAAWDMSKSKYFYGNISDTTLQQNAFISISYKHYFPQKITISVGADYEYNAYNYHGTYPVSIYDMADVTSKQYSKEKLHSTKYEAYAYGKWMLENWIVGASVRQVFPIGKKPSLSYQVNVKYNPNRKNSLIASLGQYNALCSPTYYVRQFDSAKSRQMSLDWNCNLTQKCELKAAVYWKKESLPQYFINNREAHKVENRIVGVEMCAKYSWSYFELTGSYSYINAKMKYNNLTFNSDNNFRHMAKFMLSYLNPKIINISLSCLYRGGLPYTPIVSRNGNLAYGNLNSERYNDYFTVDLSLNRYFKILNTGIIPFVTITNVTNHSNQQYIYYSQNYEKPFVKLFNKRLVYVGFSVRL